MFVSLTASLLIVRSIVGEKLYLKLSNFAYRIVLWQSLRKWKTQEQKPESTRA